MLESESFAKKEFQKGELVTVRFVKAVNGKGITV